MKILCRGCNRKVGVEILKQYITNKNVGRESDPVYHAYMKIMIKKHRWGILKGTCRKSGITLTIRDGDRQNMGQGY
jgi:hypothetical protein